MPIVPPTTPNVHSAVRSRAVWKMLSDNTVAKLANPAKPRISPNRDTSASDSSTTS